MIFLSKIRLSGFLIQDKNLTECMTEEKEKKAHTKTARGFAVKNVLMPLVIRTPSISIKANGVGRKEFEMTKYDFGMTY